MTTDDVLQKLLEARPGASLSSIARELNTVPSTLSRWKTGKGTPTAALVLRALEIIKSTKEVQP